MGILRWSRSIGCPWDEDTCTLAAAAGHAHILKWARAHGCPWDGSTCSRAVGVGEFDVLKWARCNGCPWDEYTCSRAAKSGYLDIFPWAWNMAVCGMVTLEARQPLTVNSSCQNGRGVTGALGMKARVPVQSRQGVWICCSWLDLGAAHGTITRLKRLACRISRAWWTG